MKHDKNDQLIEMFFSQQEFQLELYPKGVHKDIQYIKDMTLACEQELHEMLRETPWKPWKKQQDWQVEKAQEELIDAMHFIINLSLALGMGPSKFHDKFMEKSKENRNRKQRGY